MGDHHPRYVVREQHGTTVGEHTHSWDFLVLDSWYGYREVLWVKPESGERVAWMRRRVYDYAALLNTPRVCKCGCGQEVPLRPWRTHGARKQPFYVDKTHVSAARTARRREERRGRVS